jgi:DNA repair exonuclease SbcCD ATPase subunit
MYLLEFQSQAAKGFSATVRVPLKPGYLVLKPPAGGSSPLSALAAALFYSDGRGGDASFLAPGAKAGKAGFTIIGNDQTTYRLLRELGGAGALHRLDKTSSTFELVSDNAADIGTYLRATVGFPSKTAFEQLFVCAANQLPSRKPKAAKPGAAASKSGPQPALQRANEVEAADDIPAAQAKIKELEKELKLVKEVEEIQFKVDGVAREMDALEAQMQGSEGLRAALNQAIADQKGAPDPLALGLTPDIVERAQNFAAYVQKRDDALAKLGVGDDQGDETSPASPGYIEPLWKQQNFWIGMVAGTACLVGALFLQGYARAVALLDIPAFAFAALTALQHVDHLQHAGKQSKKGNMRAVREKKIHEAFATETAPVKDAMQILGVDSPEQVATVLSQGPLLQQKVEEYQLQLAQWEAQPENKQAAAKYQKLKAQHEALNQKLQQDGGYLRDARDVERELSRTKESIARAQQGGATASSAATALEPAAAAAELEDPGPSLFKLGTDLFGVDGPSLAALVKDRASQYFSALTDKRYVGLEHDLRGAMTAVSATGRLKAGALPPKDLDLAYLSVRLTFVEKYAAKAKVPLFLDEGLGIEEAKLGLVSRMLKHLGTLTQVIHVTSHAAFPPVADQSANL